MRDRVAAWDSFFGSAQPASKAAERAERTTSDKGAGPPKFPVTRTT